jgi:hypothetical protein
MQHTDARTQPVTAEQLQRLDELMLMLATGFIGLPVERIDDAIDDGLQLAGLAGRLVTGWRTDLETIVQANRMSYAGLQ